METIEVFLVEDNPADVLLVKVALSQVPFLKLLVAKDGEQALKMLSSPDFRPQLIILDLNMPRVDGQPVLQQYQQKNKVPIVIFSSTQNKAEVQKALSLGAREYVQKPIGFEPYADAVRGIIKRWTAAPPELPIATS